MRQCITLEQGEAVNFIVFDSKGRNISYRVQRGNVGAGGCQPELGRMKCTLNMTIRIKGIFTLEILADGAQVCSLARSRHLLIDPSFPRTFDPSIPSSVVITL